MSMLPFLLTSGIITTNVFDWENSEYILDLKKEFEQLHAQFKDRCESEVGCLILAEDDTLRPSYFLRLKDGSVEKAQWESKSVPLTELIFDEAKVEEVRKDKRLIVIKYNND